MDFEPPLRKNGLTQRVVEGLERKVPWLDVRQFIPDPEDVRTVRRAAFCLLLLVGMVVTFAVGYFLYNQESGVHDLSYSDWNSKCNNPLDPVRSPAMIETCVKLRAAVKTGPAFMAIYRVGSGLWNSIFGLYNMGLLGIALLAILASFLLSSGWIVLRFLMPQQPQQQNACQSPVTLHFSGSQPYGVAMPAEDRKTQ